MSVAQNHNKPLRAIVWASVSSLPQAADDKISLDDQQTLCRQWCEDNNCVIVDTLIVPGHSRYESDLIDMLEDYARQSIWAYHRIREHWRLRDFDVLVCYHDSRFARSATGYNFVGENVIRSGARIYRVMGGWIDENNSPFQLALGTIAATTSVQQLVKVRKAAMNAVAARGLPTSSGVAMSHNVIRDEKGKWIKQVVDDNKRQLFDDLATLILEGVGWRQMEKELYRRYGHVNECGEPYHTNRMYSLITNPTFWGHSARHHRLQSKYGKYAEIGDWIIEQGHEIPDGVTIYYKTHEPVYTGEIAEKIKAEFHRRSLFLGRAWPRNTHKFTGLLLCGECGYTLVSNNSHYVNGYRCMSHYNQTATRPDCRQNYWIHEKYLIQYVTNALKQLVASLDWSGLLGTSEQETPSQSLDSLDKEIRKAEREIRRMITQQAKFQRASVHDLYEQQITQAGERLDILKAPRDELFYQSK